MKITYATKEVNPLTLEDIEQGTVFRLTNSRELYMLGEYRAEDEIFDDGTAKIWVIHQNVQNFDFDDCPPHSEDLYSAYHLGSGGLEFFHKDVKIEVIDCELIVKEND